jgi:hypothetical protein
MIQLIFLMTLLSLCCWFFMQRKVAENAVKIAKKACQKQNVQFLNCFRTDTKWIWYPLKNSGMYMQYNFEFSSGGQDRFQGYMIFRGQYFQTIHWPVFNEPTWEQAP